MEIHSWGYHELENVHDYIQWLFPLADPSQYNLLAPVLDAEQIAKFHTDAELRAPLTLFVRRNSVAYCAE